MTACTPAGKPTDVLVFRAMRLGLALPPSRIRRWDYVLETFDLPPCNARLTVREYGSETCGSAQGCEVLDSSWKLLATHVYTGYDSYDAMDLTRASAANDLYGERLRMVCDDHAQHVLSPGAKSVPGGCEWRPKAWWHPSAEHYVDTHGCHVIEGGGSGPWRLELAKSPGIEHVGENSDCIFQGGALRAVAARNAPRP